MARVHNWYSCVSFRLALRVHHWVFWGFFSSRQVAFCSPVLMSRKHQKYFCNIGQIHKIQIATFNNKRSVAVPVSFGSLCCRTLDSKNCAIHKRKRRTLLMNHVLCWEISFGWGRFKIIPIHIHQNGRTSKQTTTTKSTYQNSTAE